MREVIFVFTSGMFEGQRMSVTVSDYNKSKDEDKLPGLVYSLEKDCELYDIVRVLEVAMNSESLKMFLFKLAYNNFANSLNCPIVLRKGRIEIFYKQRKSIQNKMLVLMGFGHNSKHIYNSIMIYAQTFVEKTERKDKKLFTKKGNKIFLKGETR